MVLAKGMLVVMWLPSERPEFKTVFQHLKLTKHRIFFKKTFGHFLVWSSQARKTKIVIFLKPKKVGFVPHYYHLVM